LIHNIWLINRSGICLLDRNYTGFEVNKQLFTGFLTALCALASQFNKRLDSLSMGDSIIYYDIEENLVVALATDRDDNEQEIRRKILDIREEFKLKFGKILDNWDGNISIFDIFLKDIDRILMLDWNFDYDRQIKSRDMKSNYPTKTIVHISQRGQDLFQSLKEKTTNT
jgi:hypothetical protein